MATCNSCGGELETNEAGDSCPHCGKRFAAGPSLTAERGSEGAFAPVHEVSRRLVTYSAPKFVVTPALVGMNALVFLAMVASGVSFLNPDGFSAVRWGADFGPLTFGSSQRWRLVTSNYVHFGIVHLLLNMWCLWGLGRLTEVFYSSTDYVLLYTLTGVSGSMLSVALKPLGISAGASGAIFGLAGVMLTTLKWGSLPITPEDRSRIYKGVWQFAGLNLIFGAVSPSVDNLGHIGGFVYGLLIGAVMGKHLDDSPASRAYRRKAWLWLTLGVGFGLLILSHTRWIVRVPARR